MRKGLLSKIKYSLMTNEIFRSVFLNRSDIFFLSEDEIKKLQSRLLEIIEDVDRACEKNGLTYVLAGGSALGAVRNGGFIPWDDDLDIIMPRADYDRIGEIIRREYPGKYYIQDSRYGKYDIHSIKIRMIDSVFEELFESEPEHTGIFIDIYSAEDTYDGRVREKLHGCRVEALMFICSCIKMKKNKKIILPYLTKKEHIRSVKIKAAIGAVFGVIPLKKWLIHTDRVMSCVHNPDSRFITVPAGRRHYFGETYTRSFFFPPDRTVFEELSLCIMNETDEYLTRMYGADYMVPPKKDQREKHAVMRCEL